MTYRARTQQAVPIMMLQFLINPAGEDADPRVQMLREHSHREKVSVCVGVARYSPRENEKYVQLYTLKEKGGLGEVWGKRYTDEIWEEEGTGRI